MSCTYPCPGGWGLGALHAGRGDSRCKASRPGGRGLTQGQGGEGSGLSGRALSAASGHHSIPGKRDVTLHSRAVRSIWTGPCPVTSLEP